MNYMKEVRLEKSFLMNYKNKGIMLSTSAKHDIEFSVLPRRNYNLHGISSFMINDKKILFDIIDAFDGLIDCFLIDVERKQKINLYELTINRVRKTEVIAVKPNDITLESCDILIRKKLFDNLLDKNILIIGTGNLATKIAWRLSERQANIFIKGRNTAREKNVINSLNAFLPKYNKKIKSSTSINSNTEINVVISFLSGVFNEEAFLYPIINKNTFIIDGGINNFSKEFIKNMLDEKKHITRLDTRIAMPYQFLNKNKYVQSFFEDIYGESCLNGIKIVAGGLIGSLGNVIVDNIKQPSQIIGIADGSGGVKKIEQHTEEDRNSIQRVQKGISIND